ncbi:MAG: AMP-binding protein [Pseudomonadota bacterium]
MVGVRSPMPGVIYPPEDSLGRYVREGCLTEETLAGALMQSLEKYGDRIAMSDADSEMTYAELDDRSTRFAAALLELGLHPLDRVVFQVVNGFELVVALIACWKADLIPVCTLAAHRDKEISYLADHAGAKAHFIGVENNFNFVDFAASIKAKTPSLQHTVILRGDGPSDLPHMEAMIAAQDPEEARIRIDKIERDPYQVTMFQLSGGTTSIPKIIPRFSNEYLYNLRSVGEWFAYTENDVFFAPLQIIHNAGMIFMFPLLLRGAQFVVGATLDPQAALSILMKKKPTVFAMGSAPLQRIKEFDVVKMLDLDDVRFVFSPNCAEKTEEVLGVPGVQIFGMTEGTIMLGRPEDPAEMRYQTVGRPISDWDEVRIVAPGTEDDVEPGEVGEFIARGPYTFHGYYDAEERNREALTSDGFYRSGDLMAAHRVDGAVYYSFEGRIKDIVSRGAEKINCEEVETAARRHPQIADIAIVAMPDPVYDERACAFIIPAADGNAPDVKDLMEFLVAEGLAKFKSPERIEVVAEFPQTDSGKLSKPKLKQTIIDILDKEQAASPAA